jgi:hypothetical protein
LEIIKTKFDILFAGKFIEYLNDDVIKSLKFDKNVKGAKSVSFQQVLSRFLELEKGGSQIWSTMHKELNFPIFSDLYIPPSFKSSEKEKISFEDLADQIAGNLEQKVHVINADPGMGKSRCAQEMHSRLSFRLDDHLVLYLPLIKREYYLRELKEKNCSSFKGELKKFLSECLDKRREEVFAAKLQERKVFIVLDGFDEILNSSRVALELMKCLVQKGARLLVTTRTHALEKLKETEFQNAPTYKLLQFSEENSLLFLQTRLNKLEAECREILEMFADGFYAIPLHLQMYCRIHNDGQDPTRCNLYQLYSKYVEIKVSDGVKRNRQVTEKVPDYSETKNEIMKLLTEMAREYWFKGKELKLSENDVKLINMSGIASVADIKSRVYFVHYSFGEFFCARAIVDAKFVQIELAKKLLYANIRRFIGNYCTDGNLTPEMKNNLKTLLCGEEGFKFVCEFGLVNLFELIQFEAASINEWAFEMNSRVYYHGLETAPFILACASSPELATKLCAIIEVEQFPKFSDLMGEIKRQIPLTLLQIILSKYPRWREEVDPLILMYVKNIVNRENLINEMGEVALEKVLGEMSGVKLADMSLEQKKVFLNTLITMRNIDGSDDKRWRLWCEVRDSITTEFCFPEKGWSLAHLACEKNDVKLLQDLRDRSFPMDKENKYRAIPLKQAHKIEAFSKMLQFLMEDAGLGDDFISIEDTNVQRRTPERQARVENLLRMLYSNVSIWSGISEWELFVKNLFGHLYVAKNTTEVEKRSREDSNLVRRLARHHSSYIFSVLYRISAKLEASFIEMLCRNFLGEFYVPEAGIAKEREQDEQILVEELLGLPGMKRLPPLLIAAKLDVVESFEIVLRNLLGSNYKSEEEIPGRQWMKKCIQKAIRANDTFRDVCEAIEDSGEKVPVLSENCNSDSNLVWKNKPLAIGLRDWFTVDFSKHVKECLNKMNEGHLNAEFICTGGVKLDEINLEQKKLLFTFMCKITHFEDYDKDEIFSRWCEVRDFITTDFHLPGDEWTLAHLACYRNDAKLLQDLRDRKFPMNEKDTKRETPIQRTANNVEVFSLMLRYLMEDDGLGEYFVALEDPVPPERSVEIQTKVEKLLDQLQLTEYWIKSSTNLDFWELFVKNLFGHLYVPRNATEAKTRSREDWKSVRRIADFDHNICKSFLSIFHDSDFTAAKIELLCRNLLGEFFVPEAGIAIERTRNDQILVEELLGVLVHRKHPRKLNTATFWDEERFDIVLRNALGPKYFSEEEIPERKWRQESNRKVLRGYWYSDDLANLWKKMEAEGLEILFVNEIIIKSSEIRNEIEWKNKFVAMRKLSNELFYKKYNINLNSLREQTRLNL